MKASESANNRPGRRLGEAVGRRLGVNGLLLLAALGVFELLLQGLTHLPEDLRLVAAVERVTTWSRPDQELYWKEKFLELVGEDGSHPSTAAFATDPELGWLPRPGLRGPFTTNSQGFRSPWDYDPDPERYVVLIVGDSFTFGNEAADDDVWPTVLQRTHPDLQALNFGVSGYGVGQMYLMLRRQIALYRPDLVVAAFIDDDLRRTLMTFRAYHKPRFALDGDRLVLTNVPLETDVGHAVAGIRRDLETERVLAGIRTLGLLRTGIELLRPPSTDSEMIQVNGKLFEEMSRLAADNGADFLLVYLPHGREIVDPGYRSFGQAFFEDFVRSHDVQALDPRAAFLAETGVEFSPGHYRGPALRIVAREVGERILELASYRER